MTGTLQPSTILANSEYMSSLKNFCGHRFRFELTRAVWLSEGFGHHVDFFGQSSEEWQPIEEAIIAEKWDCDA